MSHARRPTELQHLQLPMNPPRSRRWRLALAALLPLALFSAAQAEQRPPNVLLIVTDDQGYWDTGVSGNEKIDTPVLDRLAAESVNLTRFYAAPVCAQPAPG